MTALGATRQAMRGSRGQGATRYPLRLARPRVFRDMAEAFSALLKRKGAGHVSALVRVER